MYGEKRGMLTCMVQRELGTAFTSSPHVAVRKLKKIKRRQANSGSTGVAVKKARVPTSIHTLRHRLPASLPIRGPAGLCGGLF